MSNFSAPKDFESLAAAFNAGSAAAPAPRGAAVLIPLVESESGLGVLFEQRSFDLAIQPGEVCLPGGRLEQGEAPLDAAIRETCEELLVAPEQIELIGELGEDVAPGGARLWPFVGALHGYSGTYSSAEVAKTFAISLQWLLENDPAIYVGHDIPQMPEDFPDKLISPDGGPYPWQPRPHDVRFYMGTDPLVWGMTARVIHTFVQTLRAGL